ncbi:hypothetical protein DIE16_11015 [Burkholderia sp. Bp9090]|nr:hypothetical protein DIE16_11015 [Burkholderia sp. Bp9090]
MDLFRGNESGGERGGGAVAGRCRSVNRTKHGRRDDDAGALYRAVAPVRRHAAHGGAAVAHLTHREF